MEVIWWKFVINFFLIGGGGGGSLGNRMNPELQKCHDDLITMITLET